jgi:hypothetical protein
MPSAILEGLSVVDTTGHVILAATVLVLALGIILNLAIRARYARLERDLKGERAPGQPFLHPVLNGIVRDVEAAARGGRELNAQAIIEDRFQSDLRPLLLGERFLKAATGLVIILGLLGTFYGLTLSIGRLVHLVSADTGPVNDVTQAVGTGLTQALSGMAVAFSNSLFGIAAAVLLTLFGIFSNVTDRRVALMVQIETYVERLVANAGTSTARASGGDRLERALSGFGTTVGRLDEAVGRFESALQAFAGSTREFREFNSHLKDNIQRMSLSFGDLSETLKTQIVALKSGDQN